MERAFHIYINNQSGFVIKNGEEAIETVIRNSGIPLDSLNFMEPDALFSLLNNEDLSDKSLLIGGGDGTIRSIAAIALKKGFSFGLLPMGTMNLLAHDLGIPLPLSKTMEAYKTSTKDIAIDVGMVNGENFLCCAGIGIMPEASKYRETLRKNRDITMLPKLTAFILEHMNIEHFTAIEMTMAGRRRRLKTSSLVISNNRFAQKEGWAPSHENFKKANLQDGELGIYVLKAKNWFDKIRILFKLGLGGWKNDPVISEWASKELKVNTSKKEELVSLDGEPYTIATPLHFTVKSHSLNILIPHISEENAA